MQRSYKLRSAAESAGPRPLLRRASARAAARCCACAVVGGILPSGGSTTSHARLFTAFKFSQNTSRSTGRSSATELAAVAFRRSTRSASSSFGVMSSSRRPSNRAGRSNGMPLSSLLE
jgi:hypothetical protein